MKKTVQTPPDRFPDETIKQKVWLGILELSMKHIFARDFLPCLQDMLQQAEELNGVGCVQTALTYLFTTAEVRDKQLFLDAIETGLLPETRGTIMTIAQQFEAQGIEKGMQQGMQQGMQKGIEKGEILAKKTIAKKLLREGFALEAVSRTTDLSIEELSLLLDDKNN